MGSRSAHHQDEAGGDRRHPSLHHPSWGGRQGPGRQAGIPLASLATVPLLGVSQRRQKQGCPHRGICRRRRGQVLRQACSNPTAAARALIPAVRRCMPEGGRMQVKRFRVKGPVPQKTKTQVVPLNKHMVYENTPPKEAYHILCSSLTVPG